MQMTMRNGIALVLWLVTCAAPTLLFSPGCIEPSRRTLTFEEERQLQKDEAYTYSLPREQQGVAQRQVECNREIREEKDWHTGDMLLDAVSGRTSRCESIEKAPESEVMKDRAKSIDAVVDKNLEDALERSKK